MSDLIRSSCLNNIPDKKLKEILFSIQSSDESIENKHIRSLAINRYAESNIPIEYWTLKMERDFHGDPKLLAKYNEYISNLKENYLNGSSILFAGGYGVGKTSAATCILKIACQKNYSCLYTDLSFIVSALTQASNEEKFLAKKELMLVDFLTIDELDPRTIGSDSAADLFARSLESIFRTRCQNKLPTLMCTNSPNVIESFNGSLKLALESLMKGYMKVFPVFGEDFRKKTK